MTTVYKKLLVLGALSCSLLVLSPSSAACASEVRPNSLAGSQYTIFLYNTVTGSTSISFGEDLLFNVEAHEGVGFYLSFGSIFGAVYWAPNTEDRRDLFMLFNGFALGDFIMGWGLSVPQNQPATLFLFFGHAEEI
jgi:hypothetical protein